MNNTNSNKKGSRKRRKSSRPSRQNSVARDMDKRRRSSRSSSRKSVTDSEENLGKVDNNKRSKKFSLVKVKHSKDFNSTLTVPSSSFNASIIMKKSVENNTQESNIQLEQNGTIPSLILEKSSIIKNIESSELSSRQSKRSVLSSEVADSKTSTSTPSEVKLNKWQSLTKNSVHMSSTQGGEKGLGPSRKHDKGTEVVIPQKESIQSLSSSNLGPMEDEFETVQTIQARFEDDHGFEKVKQVYQELLDELRHHEEEGQVCLEPIREEFVSLWEGIEASHANELRLIKKDQEISIRLSTTMAKTRYLIKLSEDDSQLARRLGQNLEKAWNVGDIGDEQEVANETKIDDLRQEIFELNRNINAASHVEGQDTLKELHKIKNELEKQRDEANIESNKFRSSLNILFAKRQELFEHKTGLEEKSHLLDEEYTAQNEAIGRETERKERLAVEMQEVVAKLEKKNDELNVLQKSIQHSANKIIDTERAVMEQTLVNEGAMRDQDLSVSRLEKLRNDFEQQQRLVERLTTAAYRQSQELKSKEEEVHFLKMELIRAMRQRSLNMKRVVTLQQAMSTLEIERESLKGKINVLEKELEGAQRRLDDNKRKVEKLDKERSLVNRKLKRAEAVTSEHAAQAVTHKVAVQNLTDAVNVYSEEINVQKTTIIRLENERDFYSLEATKMAQQLAFQLTGLKKLDLAILQYQKKLTNLDTQLKKTQQTYDLAVYDKGVFARTLSDTLSEILENNTKIKYLNSQIGSLKYQLNEKDESIHQEALRYDRILKETAFFAKESKRIQRMAEDIQRHNDALKAERSTLGCAIAEMESELSKENYYANAAESRWFVFQRKLMDKNIELRDIWEKWRTLHSEIRIGAYHYRNLMRDVYSVRFNIIASRKLQDSKKKMRGNYIRLCREVTVIENAIAREKCMINALAQQMKHPLNVHRWRVLEATNPEAYEIVLKINLLTKRLVERNGLLKDQARQLMEKQTIYVEMRKGLARSPGLEGPEEVVYYQHLLVAKRHQLDNLKRELKAAEAQTTYYREEVKKLNDKMKVLKKKYFDKLQANPKASSSSFLASGSFYTNNSSSLPLSIVAEQEG